MTSIGLLGLDTSHAEAFASVLAKRSDATVTAVCDRGDVRDETYVEEFCETYAATRYDDPTALGEAVDGAMVLAVDWTAHRDLAVPLLRTGVPTFIDKPIAGTAADVAAIEAAATDTHLCGGSALPFHPKLAALPAGVADRTLYAAGYGDPFYYGVHLTDTARALAGADWTAVLPAVDHGQTVDVRFENGAHATLRFDGPADDGAFGFLDVSDRTRAVAIGSDEAELDRMYHPLVEAFLETVRGQRDEGRRVLDGAQLLLATRAALSTGTTVTPTSDALGDVDVSSEGFLADYEPYY